MEYGGTRVNFTDELTNLSSLVEEYLETYFDKLNEEVEEKTLIQAMRYSLMAGGKRIRPVLSLAVAKMLGILINEIMPIAAAIEMIHTYSLIHDDLPAMDNDDYRRGKPTNHKVFGEAMAVLAGDALLNEAAELLLKVSAQAKENMGNALEAAYIVISSAGKLGMIAGQVLDMESEGKQISAETLKTMHKKKTGALLKASIMAPAVYARANSQVRKALEDYADCIGITFQIKDDILDVESTIEDLGKPIGSDEKNKKTTYVTLYGIKNAKELLEDITSQAINALMPLGETAWFLKETALYLASRTH
jgi:geranylgeranyl diphosphate synthase type II